MILAQLFYAAFCIVFAKVNATWIANRKWVKHFWNGLIHLAVATTFAICGGWQYGLCALLIARVVFDYALNLFRGLPLGYVPADPKSIIDRCEKVVFGNNSYLPKLLYLAVIILLNVF